MEDSRPVMTAALRRQRELYEQGMALVSTGVQLQNATPPDAASAQTHLAQALDVLEAALAIDFATAEERAAAEHLAHKMTRYANMIRGQRARQRESIATTTSSGSVSSRAKRALRHNILDVHELPELYAPVAQLLGDVCARLARQFGFQEANALNTREHLLLLLTNVKAQESGHDGASTSSTGKPNNKKKRSTTQTEAQELMHEYEELRDPQQEMEFAHRAAATLHARLFANYAKWCKFVGQKPRYSPEPVVDIALFFLVWGEAANIRQLPEGLCFLVHHMLPQVQQRASDQPPGTFLATVIRPMYDEMQRDNDKKTSKGFRAAHPLIRNYDDFNEFFWTKKCLKYTPETIGQAFASANKRGKPDVVKKTFLEKRSWLRAVWSFRRIFGFNLALFAATLGFAINLVLYCPDAPIMYRAEIQPPNITVLNKAYVNGSSEGIPNPDEINPDEESLCRLPKLAACLGVDLNMGGDSPFELMPVDFYGLLRVVPFHDCIELTSGRCECYHKTIDKCFDQDGNTTFLSQSDGPVARQYNQRSCLPSWRARAKLVLDSGDPGCLNCAKCRTDWKGILNDPTHLVALIQGLIDMQRPDYGPFAMLGGFGLIGLVMLCELQNRLFSGLGIGFVGRSLPVPMRAYCRYTCFWLVLLVVKLLFDYQFMVKGLVETSLFIWNARQEDYLKYSHFLVQFSFHNILYLFFLWIPAFFVFAYDAQIFYAILSVVWGSFAGFNLRIGELRSFRILRLTFKSIPRVFNKKIVPNIVEPSIKKKHKKHKKKAMSEDEDMPLRRFERISMSQGPKPLVVKTQRYSTILDAREDGDQLLEVNEDGSQVSRSSNLGSITGVSGAEFQRIIPFAMAWNRCLTSLREADVISDRELNMLSYLIDSPHRSANRKLYPPVFLTAGKLDESIDIAMECAAVYDKLKSDKKRKDKTLQKVEMAMRERLSKDDLRVESITGTYQFCAQVFRFLLGEEHKELDNCIHFVEEMAAQKFLLKSLNLKYMQECRLAFAELMKSILETPKHSNDSSIKFQRSLYRVIDTVESVMACLKRIFAKQEDLVHLLNNTPLRPNSFFFPSDTQHYASSQLQKLVNDEAVLDLVSRAYQLLTVDNFDAEPRSEEGRRRLRFFANSLFMDMPEAKPIRRIHSLSISTPYYNEIVMYSIKDLTGQNDAGIKLLYYLQTIYPVEWENLLERIQAKDMAEALKKDPEQVQLWASYRGQTLARTIRGMMYNEDALRFLHWLEIGENEPMHEAACPCNKCARLNEMVALKFNYVCSCQIFGKQKDEQTQQAQDIEYLLRKHPSLRVAYVDGPKKVKDGPPKYFSVLIRAVEGKIVEVYRIELPGNPILGEGKPENQNHAIIFSRGQLLQCIDMNQDGYFEECLKMPNLLTTMDSSTPKKPLTIIGFREHVFTGGVSNLASFMSVQELSFVSLGQRMLAMFHVRQHYGHPDIFDKLFAMSTGGTAKASKGINLSEDIFAGFNHTLRGGRISHEEFIQVGKGRDVGMQQLALFEAKLSSGAGECVISRDAMRMASRLDFFRLHSWFYGNLGWYFTQTMTVVGVYFFIYGKVYMALSGLDGYFLSRGGLGIGGVLNTSWALQFGFLLVVPVVAVVGVEQGFRHGFTYLLWNCFTLGPLFFTFQMGTRMNFFDRTLILGGARYRATGRGFTIKHETFAELFRFYAFTQFYRGVELFFLLLVFAFYGTFSWCNCSWTKDRQFYNDYEPTDIEWKERCYANHYQTCVLPTNQSYGIMSFSLWIIAATWMWAPFFFNPSGLDWDKVIADYTDWQNWLQTTNDSADSWFGWWSNELEHLEHATWGARMIMIVRKTRFLCLAVGIYLQLVYKTYFEGRRRVITPDDKVVTFILAGSIVVMFMLMICIGYAGSRVTKKMTMKQRKLRRMKFWITCICMALTLLSLIFVSVTNVLEIALILLLAVYWFMQLCIYRLQYNHIVIRALARWYDAAVGWIVFGPIMFISMFLPFLSGFQQRVMFNSAFTSGLEVSKLFGHDAAPAQVVKVKRVLKKSSKKRDD
ncbi:TPA: hypothetical protein N0F65_009097 [Lagenidium giganteum]|uniref:1,3-beta-glucan synthase n=1 Tax=Lagenidium giganteum TaxID=4803 RepID=A0AAV2YPL4_9STRA|nr:TPA: hypothetical protein N0F65_009097 [Lagenidium giganteum]